MLEEAVEVMRAVAPATQLGIVLNLVPAVPASPSEHDRDACRALDGSFNRWFLDPLYGRGYPRDVIDDHVRAGRLDSHELPFVQDGDLRTIATATDFLGINYYSRAVTRSTTSLVISISGGHSRVPSSGPFAVASIPSLPP